MKGDIVNWSEANWTVTNMTEGTLELEQLCGGSSLGNVLIPGTFDMDDAATMCHQMGSQMTVVKSKVEQNDLIDKLLGHPFCASKGEN